MGTRKLEAYNPGAANSHLNSLEYPERLLLLKEKIRHQMEKNPKDVYPMMEEYYRELLAWGMITGVDIQNEVFAAKEFFKMNRPKGAGVDLSKLKKL